MNWLHRSLDVILRRPPRPDDERARQARVIERVKVQSDAAIARADKALRAAGDEYHAIEVRVRR